MPADYDHVFTALQTDEEHNKYHEVQLEATKRKSHYKRFYKDI